MNDNTLYAFPRLAPVAGRRLAAQFRDMAPGKIRDLLEDGEPPGAMSPLGIPILEREQLHELRLTLEELATRWGYPDTAPPAHLRAFDVDCGINFLEGGLPVPPAELFSVEGWTYVAVRVAPHVVRWRFANFSEERFAGPLVRNAFSKTVIAAHVLDRGPESSDRWGLLRAASADFEVQLVERPGLSGNRRLGLTIAETWSRWRSTELNRGNLEVLNRAALKRLTFLMGTVEPGILDDSQLRRFVEEAYFLEHRALLKRG